MKNENDTNGKRERVANDDLLAVLREIEKARQKLSDLYEKKRQIEAKEQEKRWSKEKMDRKSKHLMEVEYLKLAAQGMSMAKIAKQKGAAKSTMLSKVARAWRKEFPAHYKASFGRICELGTLTALRESPPLFSSANTPAKPPEG